jgi:lipoic acid synthetase
MSEQIEKKKALYKKPKWLRVKLPIGEGYKKVRKLVEDHNLHTICQSGNCPNMGECWGAGTATFMILGNTCTRSCGFCAVSTGKGDDIDEWEPVKVAKSIKTMEVKHAVITSVDRDDLIDGGAEHWVKTVEAVRRICPGTTMETLVGDFRGKWNDLQKIINVAPEVVSHNIETVRRLSREVRRQAKYDRSLEVLFRLKKGGMRTKSGFMVGLGETREEIFETIDDLAYVNVEIITIGQYLQPTPNHLKIVSFVTPDQFEEYRQYALNKGFRHVESSPLVRSSYHAEKHIA